MKTVVKVHDSVAADYLAWVERNRRPPTGSDDMARLLEQELFAELKRTDGFPSSARYVESDDGSFWLWRYTADTWVQFVIHDQAAWFGGRVRKVVITGISDSPPA